MFMLKKYINSDITPYFNNLNIFHQTKMSCSWCVCDEDNQKSMPISQINTLYKQQRKYTTNARDNPTNYRYRDQRRSLRNSGHPTNNTFIIHQSRSGEIQKGTQLTLNRMAIGKIQKPLGNTHINSQTFIKKNQVPFMLTSSTANNSINNPPQILICKPNQNIVNFKYHQNRQSLPNALQLNNLNFSYNQLSNYNKTINKEQRVTFSKGLENQNQEGIKNNKDIQEEFQNDLRKILNQNHQLKEKYQKTPQKQSIIMKSNNFLTVGNPQRQNQRGSSFKPSHQGTSHNIDDIMCTKTESIGEQSDSSSTISLITHCLNLNKDNKVTNSSTNFGQDQVHEGGSQKKLTESTGEIKLVHKKSLSDI